jgi:hypothetical protein
MTANNLIHEHLLSSYPLVYEPQGSAFQIARRAETQIFESGHLLPLLPAPEFDVSPRSMQNIGASGTAPLSFESAGEGLATEAQNARRKLAAGSRRADSKKPTILACATPLMSTCADSWGACIRHFSEENTCLTTPQKKLKSLGLQWTQPRKT